MEPDLSGERYGVPSLFPTDHFSSPSIVCVSDPVIMHVGGGVHLERADCNNYSTATTFTVNNRPSSK